MNRIIVLSADALVEDDIKYLKTLPNYQKYLAGGSEIKRVKSVYPTITYPAHTSMATGTYPNKHGVPGNYVFQVGKSDLPWLWFNDVVKVPDIFTAAKKSGYSTAAVFWPVTGNHSDIDYLIDEYWTQGEHDTLHDAFARSGSNSEVLKIVDRNAHLITGKERQHPYADNFVIACACDMIEQFKPDLLMIHPANIDGYRHSYGMFNEYIDQGIEETDKWIGMLAESAIKAGTFDDTNFFLVSDHGQMEIKRCININVILADRGFIDVDSNGRITDWKAYCLSGGMSAVIYLSDKQNSEIRQQVHVLLDELCKEGIYGISRVFTAEEAIEQERYGGDFSFVLETDGYTSFGDSAVRPLISHFDTSDYRYGYATHGYLPDKGAQPVLIAKGPDICENITLDNGLIVDEAPTFARILGVELPDADGSPIEDILRF